MSVAIGDPYQKRSTVVHRLDPRVKFLVAILFIVLVNLVPVASWWAYFAFWIAILLVSIISRLGLLYTARKSLLAAPFVLAAFSIPFTMQGTPIVTLPGFGWTISDTGFRLFLSILLRFWLAVQIAILLSAVTKIPDLLWALRKLGMPAVLVSVIGLMYRYLRVLGSEAARMLRARTARSCTPKYGGKPSLIWRVRVTGTMIGSLFLRAVARSERIHLAMLSRGFDGSARSLTTFRMCISDWIALFGCCSLALICSVWVLM